MNRTVVSVIGCFIAVLVLISTTGCITASPAQTASMVPNVRVFKTHPGSISVMVSGGEETNPLWVSKISNRAFEAALIEGLQHSQTFEHTFSSGSSDYHLEVTLMNLGQPLVGFDMTVTLTSQWKLSKNNSASVIWSETVSTTHTATTSDAFVGVIRLQMATEGAARKNIEGGIQRLAALRLDPVPQETPPPQPSLPPSELSTSILQKIEALKKLRAEGILTADEYETKRTALIQQL